MHVRLDRRVGFVLTPETRRFIVPDGAWIAAAHGISHPGRGLRRVRNASLRMDGRLGAAPSIQFRSDINPARCCADSAPAPPVPVLTGGLDATEHAASIDDAPDCRPVPGAGGVVATGDGGGGARPLRPRGGTVHPRDRRGGGVGAECGGAFTGAGSSVHGGAGREPNRIASRRRGDGTTGGNFRNGGESRGIRIGRGGDGRPRGGGTRDGVAHPGGGGVGGCAGGIVFGRAGCPGGDGARGLPSAGGWGSCRDRVHGGAGSCTTSPTCRERCPATALATNFNRRSGATSRLHAVTCRKRCATGTRAPCPTSTR